MKLACVELSKEQFDQVHKNIHEFDIQAVPSWWSKFKSNWEKSYSTWTQTTFKGTSDEELPQKIREHLDACLEEDTLKVFWFAGGGSQRAAFVDGNGMCMKVGFVPWAASQFNTERRVLTKLGNKDCFPKILDFGEHCMLCESVETSTDSMWKKMFYVTCSTAVCCLKKLAIREKIEKVDIAEYAGDTLAEAKMFVANVLFGKEERWKVMKQMLDAIIEDNGIAFDLDHADNWGVVERNGSRVMVCIVVGL